MKKLAVVYWSGTGNTEQMAQKVADGAKAAGAEVEVLTSGAFSADQADAFEAIIAAIYLDGGMEEARAFILRFVKPMIQTARPKPFKDYKTMLQEIIQKNPEESLEYVLTGESGPDHDKHFSVEVHLNSNVIGKGGGRSKKEAEQQAAREALELMGY